MSFQTKSQQGAFILQILILLGLMLRSNKYEGFSTYLFLSIILLFYMLIDYNLHYTFEMKNEKLIYRVSIGSTIIRKIEMSPSEIQIIQTKLTGICKKGVWIKLQNGHYVRLTHFETVCMIQELQQYANCYNIQMVALKE